MGEKLKTLKEILWTGSPGIPEQGIGSLPGLIPGVIGGIIFAGAAVGGPLLMVDGLMNTSIDYEKIQNRKPIYEQVDSTKTIEQDTLNPKIKYDF